MRRVVRAAELAARVSILHVIRPGRPIEFIKSAVSLAQCTRARADIFNMLIRNEGVFYYGVIARNRLALETLRFKRELQRRFL